MGDNVSLIQFSEMRQSKLKFSGNGNECQPLPAWRAEAATE
jgi:hypothetical protein